MRAAVLRDGRMVLRDDVPEPVPGPGQVLVGVKACGICGTDLHFAKHGDQMLKLTREMKGMPVEGGLPVDLAADVFMGHEFSAEVLEAGPGHRRAAARNSGDLASGAVIHEGFRSDPVQQHHDGWFCRADAVVGAAVAHSSQRA